MDTPVADEGMGCAVDKARSTEDADTGIGCELDEDPAELAAGDVGVDSMVLRMKRSVAFPCPRKKEGCSTTPKYMEHPRQAHSM